MPLGAFLSGGIDSSAVVAAMAQLSPEPVRTFSIGFDHEGFDELPHARAIAERFGTVHEEFQVRADAVEVVPQIVRHYGEPFADSSAIPSFYLAELTRRHVTVALNGDGGDESFAGYQRYVANAVAARLDRLPGAAARGARRARRPAARPRRRLEPRQPRPPPGRRAGARRRAARYARYVSWFDARAARRALHAGVRRGARRRRRLRRRSRPAGRRASGASVVDRMLEVDAATYLVDDLIAKVDIATMAHALEARSPLLDHQLMELAASIPAELKVRGGEKKWIFREALRPWLPDEILDRPEAGLLGAALELAADRPAGLGARHPARPAHARARLLRARRGARPARPPRRPAPTATPSGSTRC